MQIPPLRLTPTPPLFSTNRLFRLRDLSADVYVVGHTKVTSAQGTVEGVRLTFSQPMDEARFSLASDVVSLAGQAGPIEASEFEWVADDTLEVRFPRSWL